MSLEIKELSYSIKKKRILSNVSLQAMDGEFLSIVGKSGTGKSTILKLAAGLLTPDHGSITIQETATSLGAAGFMPQKDLLMPWRTVFDNLLLAAEIQKKKQQKRQEAEMWLQRVGLFEYRDAYPHELSGGMRQRVAFLRTILTGKEVLLLDEPFGALDAMTKKEMHTWISSLWQELNKTIVLVTHDLFEAVFLSDRVMVLHENGTMDEVKIDVPRPRSKQMTPEIAELMNTLESMITHEEN
ncbi:ABC transporter ATP-binding protein [Fictibacillus macauensis ZFHKF-1]|uniref:ABC transporter ATP-binding protein n=1 Tax=Fictibacillus macauensis ZFHKF-1 TaxID=1196324 RepID=I8J1X0_9BACL|nr:ABC transporter ATP-binding protein [Fictibacillus macauensis]EIT85741.1 ABC transporter ATP-binding protein [Fictibacillus macauensis ZFHKF-1]